MLDSTSPLKDRIALITGSSRGIGYALSLGLAQAGAHVIATARTQGGLEELDDAVFSATGAHATLVPLDITDGDGLDRLGAALYERFGRLDILVSNAGELGLLTPVAHLDPKVWDRAVAVNMTATYRLIRSMDPLLRRAEAARAIFLTTGAATAPRAFWDPTPPPRPAWRRWCRPMPTRPTARRSAAPCSTPGRCAHACACRPSPAEDPADLTPPEALVPLVLELVRTDIEPPPRASFPDWRQA